MIREMRGHGMKIKSMTWGLVNSEQAQNNLEEGGWMKKNRRGERW